MSRARLWVGLLLLAAPAEAKKTWSQKHNLQCRPGATIGLMGFMKNEMAYLGEWIAHHREEGVSEILLIDNNSTDGSGEYARRMGCVVVPFRGKHVQQQWQYQTHISRFNTTWVGVWDLDEFVYARNGFATIPQYLATLDCSIDQVVVPWKIFGGRDEYAHPRSVLSAFTWRERANTSSTAEALTKGIVRLYQGVRAGHGRTMGVHWHQPLGNGHVHLPDGTLAHMQFGGFSLSDVYNSPWLSGQTQARIDSPQFNLHLQHYRVGSKEYYDKCKSTRLHPVLRAEQRHTRMSVRQRYDRREVEDTELIRKRGGEGWASSLPPTAELCPRGPPASIAPSASTPSAPSDAAATNFHASLAATLPPPARLEPPPNLLPRTRAAHGAGLPVPQPTWDEHGDAIS